jgi:hypothetical protein
MATQQDYYGNPFLIYFKEAVEFKAKYAIANSSQVSELFEKLRTGHYSQVLEDPELEAFLYPTEKTFKKAEEIFQVLTEIVTILAFHRGGITMFGHHYEYKNNEFNVAKVSIW